jgi:hypothetical protein
MTQARTINATKLLIFPPVKLKDRDKFGFRFMPLLGRRHDFLHGIIENQVEDPQDE